MTEFRDLLIEIGTEELPPKALLTLSQSFAEGIATHLKQQSLNHGDIQPYATPRRLALHISALATTQAERQITRKGPALQVALDVKGNPTKAALGFARSCGVDFSELKTERTTKGAWLSYHQTEPGEATAKLIPGIIEQALAELPIPKRMRWGSHREEFVRPVHWITLLFGQEPIKAKILGLNSSQLTYGHRFHHPDSIELATIDDYQQKLRSPGYVIADFDERQNAIQAQVEQAAAQLECKAKIDPKLLDEVTALVEWPVAITGHFDQRFLEIPAEVLIETMQNHQKYFPVVDHEGHLQPHFITISNIESRDPSQVQAGNERVIRPRFSDAAFFWEQDKKIPLIQHRDQLKTVVFQEKLGSLFDKSERIAALAQEIARQLGQDRQIAVRAAHLCKCDLLSQMVNEFPSLQGTMGRYYAIQNGELTEVAAAIEEHYQPRQAGDLLPQTDCGRIIALADKIDTLVGIFAIGQKPTGVKDPFGLRRAALGVLRILIETPLHLDLKQLLEHSAATFEAPVQAQAAVDQVLSYMLERLKAYYTDQNIPITVIEAVLALHPTQPSDFNQRIQAVNAFRVLPEAESLAAANKRIGNILKKAGESYPEKPDTNLLKELAEQQLAQKLKQLHAQITPLLTTGQYTQALTELAQLKEPVDHFFDQVMVMCEETPQRLNRLALLSSLQILFLQVADISQLQ